MTNRPNYVPPIRFGDVPGPRSPRAIVLELLGAPPAAVALGIHQLVDGHRLASAVVLIFAVIAVVQAVIYVPRALRAVPQRHLDQR